MDMAKVYVDAYFLFFFSRNAMEICKEQLLFHYTILGVYLILNVTNKNRR